MPHSPPSGRKFDHPDWTANGQRRATVAIDRLRTLWINTGTLCNLACEGCYIESSPHNDRLSWFLPQDLDALCAQIRQHDLPVEELAFTGGEPFMNPHIDQLLDQALASGAKVLVLTNGLTPLRHHRAALSALAQRHPQRLALRLSLDHPTPAKHEALRGPNTFGPALEAAQWLAALPLTLTLAGRQCWNEDQDSTRAAYAALCAQHALPLDCTDPQQLVLFPEMRDPAAEAAQVPEITTACWDILGLSPQDVMCASARMAVRRQGADQPTILACTLIPYDPRFDLGPNLAAALTPIPLNHPHCATFCVLGGARCSG